METMENDIRNNLPKITHISEKDGCRISTSVEFSQGCSIDGKELMKVMDDANTMIANKLNEILKNDEL